MRLIVTLADKHYAFGKRHEKVVDFITHFAFLQMVPMIPLVLYLGEKPWFERLTKGNEWVIFSPLILWAVLTGGVLLFLGVGLVLQLLKQHVVAKLRLEDEGILKRKV